jgi:hypothetical protein
MDSSLPEVKKKMRLPCLDARAESGKLPQSHSWKVFPSDRTLQIFKDPEGFIDGVTGNIIREMRLK